MRFGSSCGSRPRSRRLDAARRFLISIHTTAFAFVVGDLKEQTAADAVCSVKSRNHLKKKKKTYLYFHDVANAAIRTFETIQNSFCQETLVLQGRVERLGKRKKKERERERK